MAAAEAAAVAVVVFVVAVIKLAAAVQQWLLEAGVAVTVVFRPTSSSHSKIVARQCVEQRQEMFGWSIF